MEKEMYDGGDEEVTPRELSKFLVKHRFSNTAHEIHSDRDVDEFFHYFSNPKTGFSDDKLHYFQDLKPVAYAIIQDLENFLNEARDDKYYDYSTSRIRGLTDKNRKK